MDRIIIRFFGLKGSWKWACRQMDKGHIIKQKSATGSVKYKLDHESQRRIVWSFYPPKDNRWENANIFLSDFEATDWVLWLP